MNLKIVVKLILLVIIAFLLRNILSLLLTHVSSIAASNLKIIPSSSTILWVARSSIISIDEYFTALFVGLIIPWLFRNCVQTPAIIVSAVYLIGYQLYYNLSVQIADKRIVISNYANIVLVFAFILVGYLLSKKMLVNGGVEK